MSGPVVGGPVVSSAVVSSAVVSGPVMARHQVRYFETDAQGVVFNMWYLAYCDEACADFLEGIGVDYESLAGGGFDFQVVHADLDWSSSLRPRETADIAVTCDQVGTTSFTLRSVITCEGRPVAVVRVVYVGVATDGSGKVPVPGELRARLMEHRTAEHQAVEHQAVEPVPGR